jgi:hypothetical protein
MRKSRLPKIGSENGKKIFESDMRNEPENRVWSSKNGFGGQKFSGFCENFLWSKICPWSVFSRPSTKFEVQASKSLAGPFALRLVALERAQCDESIGEEQSWSTIKVGPVWSIELRRIFFLRIFVFIKLEDI